jgi:hypothetical protein
LAIVSLMKVLIFEDNLMWSVKLQKTVKGLGHEGQVLAKIPAEIPSAEAAIVNLGSETMGVDALLPLLREAGVWVVGHAGHKEKGLLQSGREAGCDLVVTNSVLTFKLDQVLAQAENRLSQEIPDPDED